MTTESMGLLWLLKNSYDAVLSLMPDMSVVTPSISKSFNDMWNSLSCHIEDGLAYITEKWEVLSGFFTETVPGWIETTKDKFVTAWDTGKDLLKTKWDEVVKFFTVDVPKYFTDWLTTAVDNVAAPIAATWARVVDWFLRVNTDITTKYEEIKAFGSNIISGVKDTWCNVVEFFTVDVPAKMKETWESIKAFGSNIISGVKDTWCNVVEFFTKTVPNKMKETWESIKAFGVDLLGTAETGLKMYWDHLVDFYTVKIPAAMKAVWEIIKAGGTGILDNISAKWESLKCFFTDTIPETISNFLSPLENFDIMAKITEGFATVKTFFTKTVPDKIAEFDPLKDFDLLGSLTTSISELLASIVSIIPSGEEIKKMLINAAMVVPGGEKILQLVGLVPKPEENADAHIEEFIRNRTKERRLGQQVGVGGEIAAGTGVPMRIDGIETTDPMLLRRYGVTSVTDDFKNQLRGINPQALGRLEAGAVDQLELIANKLETLISVQGMGVQNEGLTSMVNNQTYVTAPQGSTDTESSWVNRYVLGRNWQI